MNALQEQFVAEARELIQQATEDLIAMEREGVTAERRDRVFRAFHTLKGSAGVVELPTMGVTMHAAEDLLETIQAGGLVVTPAIIDEVLACLDLVSGWVDAYETGGAVPATADAAAQGAVARLRALTPGHAPSPAPAPASAVDPSERPPEWVTRLIDSRRDRISGSKTSLVAVLYEPRADCFFDGDDPIGLMRQVPDLLALRVAPRSAWPPLDEYDPYQCNLRIEAISGADTATLSSIFRLVMDQVRFIAVPAPGGDQDAALIAAILAEQCHVLRVVGPEDGLVGRLGAVARAAARALRYGARFDEAAQIERAGVEAMGRGDVAPLLSLLDTLSLRPAGAATAPDSSEVHAATPDESAQAGSRTLRVDESRIDVLVNLASELVVLKNGFAHFARQAEAEAGGSDLARGARRELDAIDRLAGELHAAILQLRMVPAAQVFRSFPRLVRDLSRQLGKLVRLVTEGETVESDKTIVDRLFEPVLHLVRNALDHGIESPELRRAAGKPETATVMIKASRAGDRFIIEVSDDGRGIDPAVVRRKAAERGSVPPDELAALADDQVIDLIFSAGFSTATEVSDLSGRGVGMDVVRTMAEQVGGRVSVTSSVGTGTSVRLDLPTTIAISRLMVVEAGGQIFGIPMESVTETLRLDADRISRIKGNEGFVLRDRVVPICSLAELMHLPQRVASGSAGRLVVVAEVGGRTTALEVDAIRDRLEAVLKPMKGVLSGTRGYAGTSFLADGGVLLVLDMREVLQ